MKQECPSDVCLASSRSARKGALRISLGCRLEYEFSNATPILAMLNVDCIRYCDLELLDYLTTSPCVPIESYRDGFGNWCSKLRAPPGTFTLATNGIFLDSGKKDPVFRAAYQHALEDLPSNTFVFLLGSRYCDTDLLSDKAWRLFGNSRTGWARVQAICDYVHQHVTFRYEHARPTRTASQTLAEGSGDCRDFTHLAISFCRCMNIPARYCTGYLSDVGEPEPHAKGDFAAWMEVFLANRWWVFDPRNNQRRIARFLIGRGRDAADVPLTRTFGENTLRNFEVWTEISN
ncbi:Transglutaminase-like enzyme, putative cysteine protease [Roseibium suaedae]|uniref:Transglutaminase-like enzyme, putative cysteine protease n=2 Tax=Roseibium suaedae TaxID=735517 RepID=A0A1M7PI67_9HYPH|nr:Transglutaminase-like enzyme, putative cysteine protease [Roseibium suaedae]